MNASAREGWRPPGTIDRSWLFMAVLALSGAATIAATVVGNGNVAVALAPILAVVGLATICVAPVRVTLLSLVFLVLALDAPGDAQGIWNSPFSFFGQLLTYNLNQTIPVRALAIPLMVVIVFGVLLIHVHRRLRASRIDDRGDVAVSPTMLWGLAISCLSVMALSVEGYLQAGNTQMTKNQVQMFLLLLLMAYLFTMTLRGVRDYKTLGRVIVAAACTKAVLALWVGLTVAERLDYRTNHGDSMLFASATIMLIAVFYEHPSKRNAQLCLAILPLIFLGMLANNRRLAWVELAAGVMALALISRRTRLKIVATKAVLLAMPVLALYVAIGWNSNARVFAPVRTIRSVGDAEIDRSTLYRDIEDYNLLATLKQRPISGSGFGQPYIEVASHDDLSFFKEFLYLPHNTILGLWVWGGLIGFTGLTAALTIGIFLAARRYYQSASPVERAAAFTAIASILIYLIQCWGDIGFSDKRSSFLVGPALAVAGQLGLSSDRLRGRWASTPRQVTART